MMKLLLLLLSTCYSLLAFSQQDVVALTKNDREKDIELITTEGTIILRLSDSTPQHRDNFLRLVKSKYYDSVLFHRVIKGFMIQSGDTATIRPTTAQRVSGKPGYTLPAEIITTLFHKKGALAAARNGDAENPERRSSGSQFYIVHGSTYTDKEMDSIEAVRLQGRKISPERRAYYKTIGGTPQLDGNYTIFGEVVHGQEVVDKIATVATATGPGRDKPLQDVRILSAKLVKRKK